MTPVRRSNVIADMEQPAHFDPLTSTIMKALPSYLTSLALAGLLTGCVGTGPNTQQGAVGGAALGALAGAIIGNNSGGHNAAAGALIGGAAGAIAGGTIGNSIDNERGTLYTSESQATTTYTVAQPPAPPPPQPEVVVYQPGPEYVWVPGYWAFNGSAYIWIGGRWARPPHHRYHAYYAPHWEHRGGSYVYIQGYWH